jgi:Family of unknown function (DUF6328)
VVEPVSPKRENRELIELLNELRILLPGVQVLFAFLLTVPLTGRFTLLTGFEKGLYLCAFFASAAAAVMLTAPTAFHRIQWRRGDKEALLLVSNRLAVAGLAFLAVAMVAVVALVSKLVTSGGLAIVLTAAVAAVIVVLWFAIPIWQREHDVLD